MAPIYKFALIQMQPKVSQWALLSNVTHNADEVSWEDK